MTFTVEYSVRQDCFHISDLTTVLDTNQRTSLQQIDNDYRIIGLFDTWEKANEFADTFRKGIETCKVEMKD